MYLAYDINRYVFIPDVAQNRKFIILLVVTTDNFGFIILMTKQLFLVSIWLGSTNWVITGSWLLYEWYL